MLHREVQKGIDVPFSFSRFDSKGQVIPTSGTYDIKDNSGTSVQNGVLVIDADGNMSFDFLTANNDTVAANFKIELLYVVNTVDTREYILFDVVETPLINIVTDKDLFVYVNVLRDKTFEKMGQTTSPGTTTTIVDVSLLADNRDWTGARGRIVQSGNTLDFRVTTWNRTTTTITFEPAIVATAAGDFYNLRQSFDETIEESFSMVRQDVRNKFGYTAGFIDSNVLKNLVVFKSLMFICNSNIESADDKWSLWTTTFMDDYKSEWGKLQEPYDTDNNGNISDKEDVERKSTAIVQVRR